MENFKPRFGNVIRSDEHTVFCGPSAISVLTGLDVREIENRIVRRRKCDLWAIQTKSRKRRSPQRAKVTGMSLSEILTMIESFGLLTISIPFQRFGHGRTNKGNFKYKTVYQWLNETQATRGDDIYLIVTGDHVLLISGNHMVDNWNGGEIRPIRDMQFKRSRLENIYCVLRNI